MDQGISFLLNILACNESICQPGEIPAGSTDVELPRFRQHLSKVFPD
jgi:hypothetical protein